MENQARIEVDEDLFLSPLQTEDLDRMVEFLKDPLIHQNTLTLPNPYHRKDAGQFLEMIEAKYRQFGWRTEYAIRLGNGAFIGMAGFLGHSKKTPHTDEIGYWMAKPYRGKGRMSRVVQKLVSYGFNQRKLIRITAKVFHFNSASARVLEKAGFEKEGLLRRSEAKNGHYIDAYLYSIIHPDYL
jgi:ribosomal-protein-alanine N-acetyltransferase